MKTAMTIHRAPTVCLDGCDSAGDILLRITFVVAAKRLLIRPHEESTRHARRCGRLDLIPVPNKVLIAPPIPTRIQRRPWLLAKPMLQWVQGSNLGADNCSCKQQKRSSCSDVQKKPIVTRVISRNV
jgi:hypothetical protein